MQDVLSIYQQQPWLLFLFVGVVSLCVGSFLNVVIYRLPVMLEKQWQDEADYILSEAGRGEAYSVQNWLVSSEELMGKRAPCGDSSRSAFNLAVPGSACPNCKSEIKAWQNIPVISYLLLRGKCGNCKIAISKRYPLVEAATAAVCLLLFTVYGVSYQFLAMWLLTFFFIL